VQSSRTPRAQGYCAHRQAAGSPVVYSTRGHKTKERQNQSRRLLQKRTPHNSPVTEGKPKTITELGDVAENYVEAHATDIVFGLDPRLPKFRSAQSTTRRCYRCGKAGHISSQCSRRASDDRPASPSKTPGTPYAQPRAGYPQPQTPRSPQFQRFSYPRSPSRKSVPRCFLCNRPGHFARNCLSNRCPRSSTGEPFVHARGEDPGAGSVSLSEHSKRKIVFCVCIVCILEL